MSFDWYPSSYNVQNILSAADDIQQKSKSIFTKYFTKNPSAEISPEEAAKAAERQKRVYFAAGAAIASIGGAFALYYYYNSPSVTEVREFTPLDLPVNNTTDNFLETCPAEIHNFSNAVPTTENFLLVKTYPFPDYHPHIQSLPTSPTHLVPPSAHITSSEPLEILPSPTPENPLAPVYTHPEYTKSSDNLIEPSNHLQSNSASINYEQITNPEQPLLNATSYIEILTTFVSAAIVSLSVLKAVQNSQKSSKNSSPATAPTAGPTATSTAATMPKTTPAPTDTPKSKAPFSAATAPKASPAPMTASNAAPMPTDTPKTEDTLT